MNLQQLQQAVTPEFLSTLRSLISHFEENMVDLELNDVDWDEIEYFYGIVSCFSPEVEIK